MLLCKELKQSFRPHNLLLTSAFGASTKIIDEAYDIPSLNKYLDYLHIMNYDYGGAWDRRITANAPLDNQGILTVKYTLQHLIKLGASPSKIVMGIPFYGRTFITSGPANIGDASSELGFQGVYTRENGFMGFNEICELLSNSSSGWNATWDMDTHQAIARYRDEAKGETRVAVYDSPRTIVNKMHYAVLENLAGAMVWSIDTDDFRGSCKSDEDTRDSYIDLIETTRHGAGMTLPIPKRVNTNYPLLRTINEAILVSIEHSRAANEDNGTDNEIPHGDVEEPGKGCAAAQSAIGFGAVLLAVISQVRRA